MAYREILTLHTILAFIIVLGPLIAIHEFGHFWVARRVGVKVLVYSIGFGRPLIKWHDKQGTQYQIAMIPLGGYVRMVDEREGEVPEADLPYAFTRQPVLARMAIVAAGPLINLLLAVFLYWVVFLQGTVVERAVIGKVIPGSAAAVAGLQAGDRIRRIDNETTTDWAAVNYALINRMGETGALQVTVLPRGQSVEKSATVKLDHFMRNSGADPFKAIGFTPFDENAEAVIGDVIADGAGARQGLLAGDRVLQADGKAVSSWAGLVNIVQAHADKPLVLVLQRQGKTLDLTVTPEGKPGEQGKTVGKLGISLVSQDVIEHVHYGPVEAMNQALKTTGYFIGVTLESLVKMVQGKISVDNLSGPITIAKVAGQTASMGWVSLLGFMALLSVSLGVLNLLPIPVLDGGHLVYYGIEGVLGRPLSEKTQMLGLRIGIALMGSLMLLAIFNDLSRLFQF